MAKEFHIKLSPAGIALEDVADDAPDKRGLELAILQQLFELAANQQKGFAKVNECLDVVGQVKNIDPGDAYIKLTKGDLAYAAEGLAVTAGTNPATGKQKRPTVWQQAGELFEQLEKPEGVDDDKGEEGETKE